jgi:mono/diheme cytochrome c family protein
VRTRGGELPHIRLLPPDLPWLLDGRHALLYKQSLMDRRLVLGAAGVLAAGAAAVAYRAELFGPSPGEQWALIQSYCLDCHNAAEAAGGLAFEGMGPDAIAENPELFETAIRKLRGRHMPPAGNPQPDGARVNSFVAWLERTIDREAELPHAGHVPIQRLNRVEYAAAVKDLVGVEIDPAEYLPAEIEVDGLDKIAAALSVSPAFLEQYVTAARHIAHLAVGEVQPKVSSVSFPPPPPGEDQDDYIDGMPLGTRGGVRFTHRFPADGEYRITMTELFEGQYARALESEHTVVMLLDRIEVFRGKLGGRAELNYYNRVGAPAKAEIMQRFANIPVQIKAGEHEIAITFIERARAATEDHIYGFQPYGGFDYTGKMRVPKVLGRIEIDGPFGATGVSRTPSRDKIFVCTPASAAEERSCAERIATTLARRAFRRSIGADDLERLMPFYEAGRAAGHFDLGVEHLVAAILASPEFLYRAIVPDDGDAGEAFALDDYELATRLAFFLWNQGPDEELLDLAAAGRLRDEDVLEAQVERMLADPRAHALVTGFALRWLNVDDLAAVVPDDQLFPDFTDQLRDDFAKEIELFVASVLLEDRDVRELLTADWTFVNERLARHYGMRGVHGPQFRRVRVENDVRRGLLGKAAVLLRTSYGNRTSPVLRGAWVLDKLMNTPPTPPPPGVETNLDTPEGEKPKTVRERLERHRQDPNCKACHGVVDPYGLALENFSVTGQWRDVDPQAEEPIDARTELSTGEVVNGPAELRQVLLSRPDQFVQAITAKLMMYALGRELEYFDMSQVRAVVRRAARDDYRFASIVKGIVASDAFRMQAPPHAEARQITASAARR